ncbi:2,4,5-trihydroxytoluene oxygenase [Trinickia symbiotica]|uniref:2,4,5-trihydroxytoluene oxygenase n=1 Tax=Trinickia symbiotica TaxID=863227 RepID=UPI000476BF9D|nr:2,4,5-trihydroxytoluene oxygenase [Trinickia symbiotica]
MQLLTAQPARHPSPTTKATSLAHLIFERPDLKQAERFLVDFGLSVASRTDEVLYMRGTSGAPYCYRVHRGDKPRFVGLGFTVGDRVDLEKLAALPGAGSIERVEDPGGGERVFLRDPAGFAVEVLHGQTLVAELPHREPLQLNSTGELRRVNGTQRPPAKPPEVIRLGHSVLEVANYQTTSAWYTQHLGLIPSDVQVLPDGSPAVTFFRLDLGDTPADHHTLALAQSFMPLYSHSAYEVVDADAIGMGQRVLREQGWKHAWGIGRHILGSQIFDYWEDPWADKHEHYCDGDMFTADRPTGVHVVSREAMSQWGPPMPTSFTKPRLTPAAIGMLIRNLRRSPDLTLRKLVTLARLFA